jgi:hypothetical protein
MKSLSMKSLVPGSMKSLMRAGSPQPGPELVPSADEPADPEVLTPGELLPLGLLPDLRQQSENFAARLEAVPRSALPPSRQATDLAKAYAQLHQAQLDGWEAAREHTRKLLEEQRRMYRSKLDAAKFRLAVAKSQLELGRSATGKEKQQSAAKLMEEMTRKSNELMKLEAAKAAKEAEEAEAEAAAQHAPPPASLLASEAALEALREARRRLQPPISSAQLAAPRRTPSCARRCARRGGSARRRRREARGRRRGTRRQSVG